MVTGHGHGPDNEHRTRNKRIAIFYIIVAERQTIRERDLNLMLLVTFFLGPRNCHRYRTVTM